MFLRSRGYLYIYALIILSSFTFIHCSEDDPVVPAEGHFEAVGVYLHTSGIKVASILRGVTNDTLFVSVNDTTDHFSVQFYNEDEEIVDPPNDNDKILAWQIDDDDLAIGWQHPGEEGGYEFHLIGKQTGETAIELFIQHAGHNDFRSGKIPIFG